MRRHLKENSPAWLVTCLLVGVIYFVISWRAGVNQLAGGSILSGDLSQQYLSFFQYYRHVLTGGWSQFGYSFSNGLGGTMAGNWAYYLLSPMNLITLLFPAADLPTALFVIVWLKIIIAGGAFTWFIQHAVPKLKDPYAILLGTAYALNGFVLHYQSNLMWLDGIMLLPLLVWFMLQLFAGRSWIPYTVLLTVVIICNYYMGYMIAAFLVAFFIYLAITHWTGIKDLVLSGLRFAGASLLSGVLSAVVLVPLAMDLSANKANIKTQWVILGKQLAHAAPYVPTRLLAGNVSSSLPSLFIGMAALLAAFAYLFNRKESLIGRLSALAMTVFLTYGIYNEHFYLFWHGYQEPQNYPYRFVYLLGFWLLVMAGKQLASGNWDKLVIGATALGALALFFYAFRHWHMQNLSYKWLVVSAFAAACMAILVLLGKRYPQTAAWLLLIVSCGELALNGLSTLKLGTSANGQTYRNYQQAAGQMMAKLPRSKTDFSRTEKTFMRSGDRGESYALNYRGVSAFSSNNDPKLAKFLSHLGIPAYGYYESYFTGTKLTDSLFGVKYLVTAGKATNWRDDFNNFGSRADAATGKPAAQSGVFAAFKNKDALPLGFATAKGAAMPQLSAKDVLGNQSKVLNSLSGDHAQYFQKLKLKSSRYVNVSHKKAGSDLVWRQKNRSKKAYVELTYAAKKGVPSYFVLDNALSRLVDVTLNGQPVTLYTATKSPSPLGVMPNKDRIKVRLNLKWHDLRFSEIGAWHLNQAALTQATSDLKSRSWQLTQNADNHLSGSIDMDEKQQLMTTIPYTKGWQATVDGKPAAIHRGLGRFIAINVPANQHEVSLRFKTPGLMAGAIFSLLGLLVLLVLWWLGRSETSKEPAVL